MEKWKRKDRCQRQTSRGRESDRNRDEEGNCKTEETGLIKSVSYKSGQIHRDKVEWGCKRCW